MVAVRQSRELRQREPAAAKVAPQLTSGPPNKKPKTLKQIASKPSAEPHPLSKAAREHVARTIEAHATLRELGRQIEQRMARHPMQGVPTGVAKCPSITVPLSRDLYEHTRIARGKDKDAWRKVVNSLAEGVRKRAQLKRAKTAHKQALENDDDSEAATDFDALPAERKAKYFAATATGEDDDAGEDVVERKHKCVCTVPRINHAVLALSPAGLRLGACVTMHGRQELFAAVSKLTLTYDCVAETLTATCEVDFQQRASDEPVKPAGKQGPEDEPVA